MSNKKEIIKLLEKENKKIKGKYNRVIIIFEAKKLPNSIGMLKGEYYENKQIIYRGSLAFPLSNKDQKSFWNKLKVNENKIYGFLFDSKKDGLLKLLKEFFERSLEDGKIQDFLKT